MLSCSVESGDVIFILVWGCVFAKVKVFFLLSQCTNRGFYVH